MSRKLKELLAHRAAASFFGRNEELAILHRALEEDGPLVVHVHGIPGIGKSSLAEAFAERGRAQGVTFVCLDCRAIEPSAKGFLQELGASIGCDSASPDLVADRLRALGDRVVLTLDTYEIFRMMDTWLRQVFVPALHDNARVFFFGREAPVPAWLVTPGWQEFFQSITLGPLRESEARELLLSAGVREEDADRVNGFARGHPLALKLAAAAIIERPDLKLEEVASQHVITEVTRMYLADVKDPLTRRALQAASVIRRTTRSLMGVMLPDVAPQDAYERLQKLPFVESAIDGLVIHDAIQQAIASSLHAADPSGYRLYRQAAWQYLKSELRRATKADIWRYSADLLYLVEKPLVHEAFFPSNLQPYAIELARDSDRQALQTITERHEGPRAAGIMKNWLKRAPQYFHVVRDRDGSVAGYYLLFDPSEVEPALLRNDPVAWRIWQHLQDDPIPRNQRAVFARRWLDAEKGEGFPSDVISACFLDIKGYYVAMRPYLRRLYCTSTDYETYAPIFQSLRFKSLPKYAVEVDGRKNDTDVLDFGPALFSGWLTKLIGDDLGVEEEDVLDEDACELLVDGQRISLTPLEFGVMRYLYEHEGAVVKRYALLEDVWGYDSYVSGSNVVDAKIRSLRKKLGVRAPMIETVSGMGYRFRR
jgi:hypothetical protein